MRSTARSVLASSLLAGVVLLALAPAAVLAHGDEAEGMEGMEGMGGMEGAGEVPPDPASYKPTYFAHPEHRGVIYAHIALMTLSWVFVLPAAVMLSLARSRYTLLLHLAFMATNAAGVFLAVGYNGSTPDLYPNNAHHKVGWIATWVVSAQVVVGLLARVAGAFKNRSRSGGENGISSSERRSFIPVSTEAMAQHHAQHHAHSYRVSNDSGQGTEPNTESLRSNSMSSSCDGPEFPKESCDLSGENRSPHRYDDFEDEDLEAHLPPTLLRRTGRVYEIASKIAGKISTRAWMPLIFFYNVIDRIILILGFITMALGVIAFGRFFEGHAVFNGLAHWIKGGVFFWLGIFTLGRWAGSFGELGWAWNVRPKTQSKKWRPSSEFVESFLIFFYGSTNVFLEHLGNAGGEYTAQDLEHVSITILFIGGGLCGMLVDSTRIRDLLNTTVTEAAHEYPEHNLRDEERDVMRPPATYEFSINPIPALVILLTGIMMSSHTQHTALSSMVHKQWGDLLSGAAVSRGLTYVLMFLRPPKSILPSRPPTELLASFGLIAGGIIFMASSSDTVEGMIHYGMNEMSMYTVTMGMVGLLMAWVILMIALKGWATRRELGRPAGSYQLS